MSDDLEAIIDGDTPEPEVTADPVKDDTAVEPEKAETDEKVEAAPEETKEPEKEPEKIPLAVYLEERSKGKALEARVSEMEASMAQKPEVKAPDMFEDPQGYNEHMDARLSQAVKNAEMNMSEAMAQEKHGTETVAAAFEALKASGDQAAIGAIQNSRMPYQELMKWDKQRQAMIEVGDDPAAWKEAERARMRAEIVAEAETERAKAAAGRPAPSLASVTGIGGGPQTTWTGPASLDKVIGD
jgi:hypothetical protein